MTRKKANRIKDFFKHKYVMSAIFVIIIVGGFFLINLLGQSEEAIAGEAYRKSITSKSPEPYFQIFKEYKRFFERSGEKADFRTFNNALMRSNVFLVDSSVKHLDGREVAKNRDLRSLVNKVYTSISAEEAAKIAYLMNWEDHFKVKITDVSLKEIQAMTKPLNPMLLEALQNEMEKQPGFLSGGGGESAPAGMGSGTSVSDCTETGSGTAANTEGASVSTTVVPGEGTTTGDKGQIVEGGPTSFLENGACGPMAVYEGISTPNDDIWGDMEAAEASDSGEGGPEDDMFGEIESMGDKGTNEPIKSEDDIKHTYEEMSQDEFEEMKSYGEGKIQNLKKKSGGSQSDPEADVGPTLGDCILGGSSGFVDCTSLSEEESNCLSTGAEKAAASGLAMVEEGASYGGCGNTGKAMKSWTTKDMLWDPVEFNAQKAATNLLGYTSNVGQESTGKKLDK